MTVMFLAEADAPSIVPEELENRRRANSARSTPPAASCRATWSLPICGSTSRRCAATARPRCSARRSPPEMSRDEIAQALGWARAWLDAKGPVTA